MLVGEFFDGILGWDSRLGRTLRLLYSRPGALTDEFVAGRRARYLGPLRLYLLASVFFMSVYALFGEPALVWFAGRGDIQDGITELREVERWLSALLIALMPAAAVVMAVLFRTAQRRLIEHAVFVLHLTAATLLAWGSCRLLAVAAARLGGFVAELIVTVAIQVFVATHVFYAARRHYGLSEFATFWRVTAYFAVTGVMFGATTRILKALIAGAA